jgi:signal transduction histidine kinase
VKNYEKLSKNELIALLRAFESGKDGTTHNKNGMQKVASNMHQNRMALEVLNDELQEPRQSLEEAHIACTDFYDFAPIGFVTFDARGVIRELNLTGAEMLGRERSLLLNTPFISHIIKSDRKKFLCHLAKCKQSDEKVISAICVSMERGNFFHLQLQSKVVLDSLRKAPLYLTALIDISEVAEIRFLAEELTRSEEKDRHAIATELQEQILGFISMAQMKLGNLYSSVESPDQLATIDNIRESIDIAGKRIGSLARQIWPTDIYETSLENALHTLVKMAREEQNIPAEFQCDMTISPIAEEVRAVIFQVIRDLLEFVARQTQAKRIVISLSMKKGVIMAKIEDNGLGFSKEQIIRPGDETGGFGLLNARRRIEYIGGVVRIDSVPGRGTSITLLVPLKEKRGEIDSQEFVKDTGAIAVRVDSPHFDSVLSSPAKY